MSRGFQPWEGLGKIRQGAANAKALRLAGCGQKEGSMAGCPEQVCGDRVEATILMGIASGVPESTRRATLTVRG